jgi:hypothetical protein
MDSALVIPVRLPPRLERERRLHVSVAALGVPAHLTLLYPFIAPGDLTARDRRRIASILRQHSAFDFRLGRIRAWPTALFRTLWPGSKSGEGNLVGVRISLPGPARQASKRTDTTP